MRVVLSPNHSIMKQVILFFLVLMAINTVNSQNMDHTIYGFTMNDISGNPVSLGDYEGKVVMIVNVASKCGLTPQYVDLEATYKKYQDKGLVILGFPANDFMGQEPGTNEEIQEFCSLNYGVSFPMFEKIGVKGKDQHKLYEWLTSKDQNGVLDANMKWNFQKFLVNREGHLVSVIDPTTKVTEEEVVNQIEQLLN